MAGTDIETLMKWLDREEQEWGIQAMIGRTVTEDRLAAWLQEELGMRYSPDLVPTFYEVARAKYEIMPAINISTAVYERKWGKQLIYRDINTGKFISYKTVAERFGSLGLLF